MKSLIKDYDKNGFVLLSGILDSKLLADCTNAAIDIQENIRSKYKHLSKECVFEKDLDASQRNNQILSPDCNDIFIIGAPMKFSEVFKQLVQQEVLLKISKTILDSKDIYFHFMNLTIKQPLFGRKVAWHRDFPNKFICTAKTNFFRFIISLDGMDNNNGGIRFHKNSHLIGDTDIKDARYNKIDDHDIAQPICNVGDILVIHPKIAHSSDMNTSSNIRRNIVIQVGSSVDFITGNKEEYTGLSLRKIQNI